jgi:hypothetical protein
MPKSTPTKKSWKAMWRFAHDQPMTDGDWEALSWLTLIDRNNLYFGPGNVRWATTAAERADNLAFFKNLDSKPPGIH